MFLVISFFRILGRYWFIAPILLFITALQLGFGFVVTQNSTSQPAAESPETQPALAVSVLAAAASATAEVGVTPLPTLTPTPSPTFTPSATRTPTPTKTPTGTPSATATPAPSATPTNTSTPTPRPTPSAAQGFTATVPILMYHYLSEPPPGADAIRRDLSVSPQQFESHLAYLRQKGFETITLSQLSYALSQNEPLPPKPVIITFDDGYRDNYEFAFPILRTYGYVATFFVFTQVIDTYNVSYLTWEMVQEMHQAGMEFGSHSYRHADLSNRDVDFLVYEILGSKEAIEERIQEPVRFFSYPSGQYDALTIEVLESAHFWGAVTTHWGAEQAYPDRFEMPRLRIRGNDTAEHLAEKLSIFAGE